MTRIGLCWQQTIFLFGKIIKCQIAIPPLTLNAILHIFPLYFGKIIWEPLHNKVLFLQQQESTGSSGQSQSISKSVDDDGGAPPPPPTSSGSTLTVPGASTMIRSLVRSQSSIEHGGSCLDGHQQSKRSRSMIRIEIFFKRYFNRGSVV